MKIIVVGCGKIGSTITESLVKEGHDVVVVDDNSAVLESVTNMYDVICVCGNGADYETLSDADASKADMFLAVTGSDELNMLSCFIARKMGAKHTIARIRNPEYNDERGSAFIKQQLELSLVINPEQLAAQELFNILKLPSAVNIETFSRRNFEMVELKLKADSPLDNMRLIDIRKKYAGKFLCCVVKRGDEVYIPDGNFVLKSGDKIGLTAATNEIQKLLKQLSLSQKQARNVMIMGASRTGYYLTKLLLSAGNSVKVIDTNKETCNEMARELPNATVIYGDGAEQELLLEEGINSMDAFVALTGMDEENILISMFASSQDVPKVISKVNRTELARLAEGMGLDCIISPRHLVCDVILRYARALQNSFGSKVETLYKLMDGNVEALEFAVTGDFEHVNIPIKELKLKKNIIIAGILRKRKSIIPSGDDVIMPDDNVIIIAADHHIDDLSDIIQ